MKKIKLDIKDTNGKVIHTLTEKDFDMNKPLVFVLEAKVKEKDFSDTKFLRITSSNVRLVLS